MRNLLVLILVVLLGCALFWYLRDSGHEPDLKKAGEKVSEGAGQLKDKLNEKVSEIRTEDIKEELARTGRVVRKKAEQAGSALADATADARITTAIKGKYAVESDLSAMSISVNTTAGTVTLSGTAPSPELIQKAMRLALETEGVSEVISTLQVK
ncbi:MAG: BON domain-containing protein [Verrucomicrobiota bacterium]|nr:BON domain-containing protein [Verrucomicrobiota bacterium]